jgi:ribosomal protein L30/L7E
MNKLSSKSKHKEILKSLRLRKLEEKMKINMKKRKQILKKSKDG